jgi:hypothetical protein
MLTIDLLHGMGREPIIHGLLEADVTLPRRRLRDIEGQTRICLFDYIGRQRLGKELPLEPAERRPAWTKRRPTRAMDSSGQCENGLSGPQATAQR